MLMKTMSEPGLIVGGSNTSNYDSTPQSGKTRPPTAGEASDESSIATSSTSALTSSFLSAASTAPTTSDGPSTTFEPSEVPSLTPEGDESEETSEGAGERSETYDDVEEPQTGAEQEREKKKSVSFRNIEVREYCRCLGDNPATTHGPPLSIGWAYNEARAFDVEAYEESRPPRRKSSQMLVPGSLRESILLEQTDVTKRQINSMVTEVKAERNRRQVSVAMQEFENWHILVEAAKRRFRRFRTGVSKEDEERMLWENASKTLRDSQNNDNYTNNGDVMSTSSSTSSHSGDRPRPLRPILSVRLSDATLVR